MFIIVVIILLLIIIIIERYPNFPLGLTAYVLCLNIFIAFLSCKERSYVYRLPIMFFFLSAQSNSHKVNFHRDCLGKG